jgi:radical SAM superfamily enzyme YgiQ (UPF0313 family)
MQQDNIKISKLLNKLKTTSQTIEELKIMNNNYLKTLSMDNILPYLF